MHRVRQIDIYVDIVIDLFCTINDMHDVKNVKFYETLCSVHFAKTKFTDKKI